MKRRSFLASLAALLVARKLPAPTSELPVYWPPIDGTLYGPGDVVTFDHMPLEMRTYIRFVERIPPDVWGDEGDVAFTIATT